MLNVVNDENDNIKQEVYHDKENKFGVLLFNDDNDIETTHNDDNYILECIQNNEQRQKAELLENRKDTNSINGEVESNKSNLHNDDTNWTKVI